MYKVSGGARKGWTKKRKTAMRRENEIVCLVSQLARLSLRLVTLQAWTGHAMVQASCLKCVYGGASKLLHGLK